MSISCHTLLSLDGRMQGPGTAQEDTSDGFADGGWTVPYVDPEFLEIVDGWFRRTDAVLLGVTLGTGKRLLAAGSPAGYDLVSNRTTSAGVTYLELRPVGFRRGDFVVRDGREAASV
jgi:hypothetical protein